MLAKDKVAVPFCLAKPIVSFKRQIVEVGVLLILIDPNEGEAVLPPTANIEWRPQHHSKGIDVIVVEVFVFHLFLCAALVRQLAESIGLVLYEEAHDILTVQDISERELVLTIWLQVWIAHQLAISTK